LQGNKKEIAMRRKRILLALCGAAITMATLYQAETVHATLASGFTTSYVLKGATFKEFFLFQSSRKDQLPAGNTDRGWFDFQATGGHSDLYVVQNTWQPVNFDGKGGIASTGWHTHPGPSLIVVTAGTLTEYHKDCTPVVHNTGDTFVDAGGTDVHLIRNEGTEQATTTAVQIVPFDPAKGNRRIDVPAPPECANIE
jgi:quercetin dioxygenase-like cupin family protein